MIAIYRKPVRKPSRKSASTSVAKPIRAGRMKNIPAVDYVHSKEFDRKSAESKILNASQRMTPAASDALRPSAAAGQAYIAGLYETPLLNPEEERQLFRRFNYLKFKANRLLRAEPKPSAKTRKQVNRLVTEANETHKRIVRANLRLVISIAKRFVNADNSFDDLVSDGNLALMRAVEKFNYELGNRFSTYATYAIQRCVFRTINQRRLRRRRFITDDNGLDAAIEDEITPMLSEFQVSTLHGAFEEMLAVLDAREQHIVRKRFGFDNSEPKSFKELGDEMGVCKERVRQIQTRAIGKLLRMARDRSLEQYLDPGEF